LKGILTKLLIFIALLWITGCTNQNLASDKKESWIFAHIATKGFIPNNTTVVIPVTQDIIAFTQDTSQKHVDFNAIEFTSLAENAHGSGPRIAVLSWFDGTNVEEIRLIVTDVAMHEDLQSIIYTTETIRSFDDVKNLVSPHLYLDRYQTKKNKYVDEYRYPFYDDSYSLRRTEYADRNRIPTGKNSRVP
jgi:hypothetical protein